MLLQPLQDVYKRQHYGTIRDNNTLRYNQLGPDTGYDCINTYDCSAEMAQFLNALNITDELPKTIIYSLNPSVNAAIGTVLGLSLIHI